MAISPEVNRARVKASLEKVDRLSVALPKGALERIEKLGCKKTAFCREAIMAAIEEKEEEVMEKKNGEIRVINTKTGEVVIDYSCQWDVISDLIDEIAEQGSDSADWMIETEYGHQTNVWYEMESRRGDDGDTYFYGLDKEDAIKKFERTIVHECSRDHIGSVYEVKEYCLKDYWQCQYNTVAYVEFDKKKEMIDLYDGEVDIDVIDKWIHHYYVEGIWQEYGRFLTAEEADEFMKKFSEEEIQEGEIEIVYR